MLSSDLKRFKKRMNRSIIKFFEPCKPYYFKFERNVQKIVENYFRIV